MTSAVAYDMTFFRGKEKLKNFGVAPQSYGSYSVGDIVFYPAYPPGAARPYKVTAVAHALFENHGAVISHTSVALAETKLEDHPIPWPW